MARLEKVANDIGDAAASTQARIGLVD